jgi:hypothetical protein
MKETTGHDPGHDPGQAPPAPEAPGGTAGAAAKAAGVAGDAQLGAHAPALAMNRLRRAYLTLEPGMERYLSTGYHDDQRGVFATYMVDRPSQRSLWIHFLVNTPNIVATVDSALAAAVLVLVVQTAGASRAAAAVGGVVAFPLVRGILYVLQRQTLRPFRHQTPRFPSPPDRP